MPTITINGQKIEAPLNATLLSVIRENNIAEVPTLCHNDLLEPYSSCFICVVDIEGARSLKPACATTVTDGMVVETDNERIHTSRKTNLELLLSNHRADCYPPCRLGCPAEVDIQGYIALAARGMYREGQKLMLENNPLPMVCGRICARPCELQCRRNYVDEPVDIKNIKRFMADRDLWSETKWMPEPGPSTGKHVAVVGSGPAGLSAAYYLRIAGHDVTIFEMMPEPGGMMRYGIPEYRLPKKDLRREIDSIIDMGITLKCGTKLGKDITLDELKNKFHAVYLGTGAWIGSTMNISGEDLEGVTQGVDFLREVNEGKDVTVAGKVFVIGGGNTAIDAARTALRKGADSVTMIYRRTEAEMPADNEEIADAKAEGIEIRILNNPTAYVGTEGKLTGIRLVKMELGEPDESGRRRPRVMEGSEYEENVDLVIAAIGQKVDGQFMGGVELTKWGTIAADEQLFTTNIDAVFAGGDAVLGPDVVIGAVAHGRKGAHVIDRYLKGEAIVPENRLGFRIRKEDFGDLSRDKFSDVKTVPRNHMAKISVEERITSFVEVETGFTEEQLQKEASRCLECGCQDIHECSLKEYAGKYGAEIKDFDRGELREKTYDSQHRYIAVNTEKCITCGLCVRTCKDVQKQAVFSIDRRGFQATPVPYTFTALDDTNCISCGMCAAVCPVGAIHEKLPLGKPGPFAHRHTETHCGLCGDVCAMVIETRDDRFMKISSKIGNHRFFDPLCRKGRFGYEPFVTMETAVPRETAESVKTFLAEAGQESVLLVSPRATIEEIDFLYAWAEKKKIPVYSTAVDAVRKKRALIAGAGLSFSASVPSTDAYDTVYLFGDFTEDANSVSMRKLLRNDKETDIRYSFNRDDMYFSGKKFSSDSDLIGDLKNNGGESLLAVLNLDTISPAVLEELVPVMQSGSGIDLLVLRSHGNLDYLEKLITAEGPVPGTVSLAIACNDGEGLEAVTAQKKILFTDADVSSKDAVMVPVPSLYEKSGTILDQFGVRKQIVRAAVTNKAPLGSYFV